MTGQGWTQVEKPTLECYSYRRTDMGGKTITLLYNERERIYPVTTRRSRSGRHGEDCYYPEDLKQAKVVIHILVSNSGKDHSAVYVKENFLITEKLYEKIIEDLKEYNAPDSVFITIENYIKKQAK